MKNYKAIWLYLIFSPFLLFSCREIDTDQEEKGRIVFNSSRLGLPDPFVMDSEDGDSSASQIVAANIAVAIDTLQSPFGNSDTYVIYIGAGGQDLITSGIDGGTTWTIVSQLNGYNYFTAANNLTRIVFYTGAGTNNYMTANFSDIGSPGVLLYTVNPAVPWADFSPDGEKIAFVDVVVGTEEISVINSDGSGYANLTDSGGLYFSRYPAWSPLGDRIAYICERTDGVNGDVFIMNSDGSEQHYIAGDAGVAETMPKWSPDGTRVAYLSGPGTDREIFIVNPDIPGSEKQITNGSGGTIGVTDFNWSPFGTKLVFSADWEDATGEIYTVNDDGSSQTRLTFNATADISPCWIR